MNTSVDLSGFLETLKQPGPRTSSFAGAFLIVMAIADTVAGLYGGGIVAPLLLRAFGDPEQIGTVAIALVVAQVVLMVLAWLALAGSAVRGAIPSSGMMKSIFGAPAGDEPGYMVKRVAGVCLLAVVAGVPIAFAPVPDSARGAALILVSAPLIGWALIALASRGAEVDRTLEDRSVLIGAGAGLGAVVAGLLLLGRGGFAGWAELPEWFAIAEGLILCALPVMLLVTMLSAPDHAVYRLTMNQPHSAPAVLEYSPFEVARRVPRFMTFGAMEGQIIVLTRALHAEEWRLVDVTDAHTMVPIHDRSLLVWNLSRLSKMIPDRIDLRDSGECFNLSLRIGQLALPVGLDTRTRLKRAAVAAANDVLFRNTDLHGLMERAARTAFDDCLDGLSAEVEEIGEFLDRAPSSAALAGLSQSIRGRRLVDLTAAEFHAAMRTVDTYLLDLMDKQKQLRDIRRRAAAAGATVEKAWLATIVGQIAGGADRMANERGVEVGDALRVLNVVGLRSNGGDVTVTGLAAKAEADLPLVRERVDQLVRQARADHQAALADEDRRRAELEQIVVNPHALSREDQQELVGARMMGELPGQGRIEDSPPAPTSLPPAEPAVDGEFESLN